MNSDLGVPGRSGRSWKKDMVVWGQEKSEMVDLNDWKTTNAIIRDIGRRLISLAIFGYALFARLSNISVMSRVYTITLFLRVDNVATRHNPSQQPLAPEPSLTFPLTTYTMSIVNIRVRE